MLDNTIAKVGLRVAGPAHGARPNTHKHLAESNGPRGRLNALGAIRLIRAVIREMASPLVGARRRADADALIMK